MGPRRNLGDIYGPARLDCGAAEGRQRRVADADAEVDRVRDHDVVEGAHNVARRAGVFDQHEREAALAFHRRMASRRRPGAHYGAGGRALFGGVGKDDSWAQDETWAISMAPHVPTVVQRKGDSVASQTQTRTPTGSVITMLLKVPTM